MENCKLNRQCVYPFVIFKNIRNVKMVKEVFKKQFREERLKNHWGEIRRINVINEFKEFVIINVQMKNYLKHVEIERECDGKYFEDHIMKVTTSMVPEMENEDENDENPWNNLFIKNLPINVTERALYDLISAHARVDEVIINRNMVSKTAYAFVHMESFYGMEIARLKIDGSNIGGNRIVVRRAHSQHPPSYVYEKPVIRPSRLTKSILKKNELESDGLKNIQFKKQIECIKDDDELTIINDDDDGQISKEFEQLEINSLDGGESDVSSSIEVINSLSSSLSSIQVINEGDFFMNQDKIQIEKVIQIHHKEELFKLGGELNGIKINADLKIRAKIGSKIKFTIVGEIMDE